MFALKFLKKNKFDNYEDYKTNGVPQIPDNFNFSYDVIDVLAKEDPNKVALIWTNDNNEKKGFFMNRVKKLIHTDYAYRMGLGGQNVTVAVMDTGIVPHPDFGDETYYDYRSTLLIYQVGGTIPISGKWYASTDAQVRAKNLAMLPVIRVSEMYYIQAETYARNGDLEAAGEILNTIRSNRGMWDSWIVLTSWEDFVRELVHDAQREWISEGQLFYLYKRLGNTVRLMSGEERALKREEVTLPVPENQMF